jgi:hypothetical protein
LPWRVSPPAARTCSQPPGRWIAPVGDLRAWGWVTLIISVLLLVAAGGILAGNQLARWFAVAVVGLNAIDMMFFIPAYPFWALIISAVRGCAFTAAARTWKPRQ